MEEIMTCIQQLVQDQYGNYVVQHVLEHGRNEDVEWVIEEVIMNIVRFSQHKFARYAVRNVASTHF